MVGFGICVGLLDEAVIVMAWPVSVAGPGLMPVIFTTLVPESSRIVRLVRVVIVGGSLTGRTLIVNVFVTESIPPLATPPLSLTTTVIRALPNCVAAGVN